METKIINAVTKYFLKLGLSEAQMHILIASIIYLLSFNISLFSGCILEIAMYISLGVTILFCLVKEILDEHVRGGYFDIAEFVIGCITAFAWMIVTYVIGLVIM